MITGKLKRTPKRPPQRTTEPLPPLATSIRFQPTAFTVTLADGRAIAIPLAFYPTLAQATPAQRKDWTLLNNGRGISWDALNLDLSVQALLEGAREGIPQPPLLIKLKSTRSSHA